MWLSLALALALAAAIAFFAYRRGSLTASGGIAAAIVGSVVFASGGITWGAVLIFFFVSSSALGRLKSAPKARAEALFAKGQRRDAGQVLANGGIAALLALGHGIDGGAAWWPAFIGSMAAVTADTWATEVGTLSRRPPWLITTFTPVAAGISGGVTAAGLAASLAGAVLVGVVAALVTPQSAWVPVVVAAMAGGLFGALADSVLGATLQASYYCERCAQPTEATRHRCGATTRKRCGVSWIDNDVVNVAAAIVGALVGGAVVNFG